MRGQRKALRAPAARRTRLVAVVHAPFGRPAYLVEEGGSCRVPRHLVGSQPPVEAGIGMSCVPCYSFNTYVNKSIKILIYPIRNDYFGLTEDIEQTMKKGGILGEGPWAQSVQGGRGETPQLVNRKLNYQKFIRKGGTLKGNLLKGDLLKGSPQKIPSKRKLSERKLSRRKPSKRNPSYRFVGGFGMSQLKPK